MKQINSCIAWLNNHLNYAYALIRIFLGIALFIRGWVLIQNPDAITQLVGDDKMHMWYSYITFAHLIGGALIAVGLISRLGALVQIPILFSAVFLVHANDGLMMGGESFELATMVFFLLGLVLFFGSGPFSLDRYFQRKRITIFPIEDGTASPA